METIPDDDGVPTIDLRLPPADESNEEPTGESTDESIDILGES